MQIRKYIQGYHERWQTPRTWFGWQNEENSDRQRRNEPHVLTSNRQNSIYRKRGNSRKMVCNTPYMCNRCWLNVEIHYSLFIWAATASEARLHYMAFPSSSPGISNKAVVHFIWKWRWAIWQQEEFTLYIRPEVQTPASYGSSAVSLSWKRSFSVSVSPFSWW